MRWLAAAAVSAAVLLFALPALAYKPPSGCWGQCGGDVLVGAYFFTQNGRVEHFTASLKCLGTYDVSVIGSRRPLQAGDRLAGIPTLKVGPHGDFSWRGRATRSNATRTLNRVKIALDGHFRTSSKATVSISIEWGKCGTQHLTIHRA